MWKENYNNKSESLFCYERENMMQSTVNMMIDSYDLNDSNFAFNIALNAIGGGLYSELGRVIREELGLCYSVGIFDYSIDYPDHNLAILYGYTSEEKVGLFIEESKKIINNVVLNGISEDLFNCSYNTVLSNYCRRLETSLSIGTLCQRRCLYEDPITLDEYTSRIKNVKLKDCNDAIEKVFGGNCFKIAIMNPKK